MKRLTLVVAILGLSFAASAQNIDQKQLDIAEKFYLAVLSGKTTKVIKCMDKDYRKEQLRFLKGNKEQFVNELFGGTDLKTNEYVSVQLSEVQTIEIQDVHQLSENRWEYTFSVSGKGAQFEMTLELNKSGKKYGFVGAVG